MVTRREFLTQLTVVLTLTPIACSSSSSDGGATTSTNPTLPGCDGVGQTSTTVQGHTHAVCVDMASIDAAPIAGVAFTTTITLGHDHQITLTQAQLQTLARGATVDVTTSTVDGHAHGFRLAMEAPRQVQQPTPSPPTGGY